MQNNYNKAFDELDTISLQKGYKFEALWKIRDFWLPCITINDQGANTVVFLATLHGNESDWTYATIEFLKNFTAKDYPNVKIILFPCANPYGFQVGKRSNINRKDLNRWFKHYNYIQKEQSLILWRLVNEKINFFCSFHWDHSSNKAYFYAYGNKYSDRLKVYRDIQQEAWGYIDLNTKERIDWKESDKWLIWNTEDFSFEHFMAMRGVPYIIVPEIWLRADFDNRIKAHLAIIKRSIELLDSSKYSL